MNGRERILAALNLEKPDMVPTLEWVISPDVIQGITGYTSDIQFVKDYGVDGIAVSLDYTKEQVDDKHFVDEWGIKRVSYDEYPTPVAYPVETMEDLKKLNIPDPNAEYRFDKIKYALKEFGKDKAVVARVKDVFSQPRDLMGFENFLMSFYLDPDLADALMEMITEHSMQIAKNLKELGVEVIVIGDDIANNTGLLMRPDMYKEKVLPHFNRLVKSFKDTGLYVIKHTDGDIMSVVEDLINSGIDCIDPIDPLGNMDMGYMKKTYGTRCALKGNVDCVNTLVEGTKEDVVNEVKQCLIDGGQDGGYIISSSNTIHRGVSPQNYKWFLEARKEYGRYPLDIEELKRR